MRNRMILLLTLSLCLMLTGALTASAQGGDLAFVRIGHFVGDAPAVDVYLNGELSDVQDLTLGDVTPWIAVPAGTYSAAITVADAPLANAVATLEGVQLEPGDWATISAIGSLAENSLALQPAIEDYDTPIADGVTRVNVFHAIEGMSGIDLVRRGASMIDTIAYPNPNLGNDGLGSVELASESIDLAIAAAGRPTAVIVTLPQVELLDGHYVSLFVYGTLDAPLYSIQTVSPAEATLVRSGNPLTTETIVVDPAVDQPAATVEASGTAAFIRVGHFGSDAPAVDVFLNGELTSVQNLEYGTVTDWLPVPAGTYTVAASVAGSPVDNAVMTLEEVELEADSWTTISAVGSLGQDTLSLTAAEEDYATVIEEGVTRVSVFHAMEGMSGIDLTRRGAVMISTIAFPDEALGNDGQASVELASGTVDLAIAAAGRTDAVIVTIPAVVLEENTYVAIFVYGSLEAPEYLIKVVEEAEINLLRRTS